jgi:hypothetical protein
MHQVAPGADEGGADDKVGMGKGEGALARHEVQVLRKPGPDP